MKIKVKQEFFAKMLNVSQATYSRYETGETEIPVSALIKLAKFYNTSTDYLLRSDYRKNTIQKIK